MLPHEKTHAGPKADRLALMRATHAALSQVFMLYPDDDGAVTAALAAAADAAFGGPAAAQTAHDRDGNTHRLAPVSGAPAARVCALLRDQRCSSPTATTATRPPSTTATSVAPPATRAPTGSWSTSAA